MTQSGNIGGFLFFSLQLIKSKHSLIKPILFLFAVVCTGINAAPDKTVPFALELPGCTLRFSLPIDVARDILPFKPVRTRFDPLDPAYARNQCEILAHILHTFKGPFWANDYGGLWFVVTVRKRSHEYREEITTIDGLQQYILWWLQKNNSSVPVIFDHRKLNDLISVHRWNSAYKNPTLEEIDDMEEFSIPLSEEAFLDIGFSIVDWKEGHANKWKPLAEELRSAIKSTIVIEKRAN